MAMLRMSSLCLQRLVGEGRRAVLLQPSLNVDAVVDVALSGDNRFIHHFLCSKKASTQRGCGRVTSDSRVAAIIPWHWDGCEGLEDCMKHLDEIGTAELPDVVAHWKGLVTTSSE